MPRKTQYMYETTPKKIDYRSPKNRKEYGARNNSSKPISNLPKTNNKKKQQPKKQQVKKQQPKKQQVKKQQVKRQYDKRVVKEQPKSRELEISLDKVKKQKNSTVTYGRAEVATSVIQKPKKISKPKAIVYIVVAFSLLFFVGYRNTIIDETFVSMQKLKSNLALLEKENQQLEIKIEDGVNLGNIEKIAKEKLGMQKLNSSQKIYLNLPKRDYIEPASEKVIIEEETWVSNIWKMIKNLF